MSRQLQNTVPAVSFFFSIMTVVKILTSSYILPPLENLINMYNFLLCLRHYFIFISAKTFFQSLSSQQLFTFTGKKQNEISSWNKRGCHFTHRCSIYTEDKNSESPFCFSDDQIYSSLLCLQNCTLNNLIIIISNFQYLFLSINKLKCW